MNEHLIGRQRGLPLHAPVQQQAAAENMGQNKDLQEAAATPAEVQVHAPFPVEDFTISVDQVREHFRGKGLTKSKDTIQRWCRNGDLVCKKRGVLGRYFTTECSLKALEEKLLPDMIAENSGAAKAIHSDVQVHEAETNDGMLEQTGASEDAHTGVQPRADETIDERSSMQEQAQIDADARTATHPIEAAKLAELRAQVEVLRSQLEQSQSMNKFLQDEITSSRSQRGDVVDISKQMLATLETIAVGGRLEKPATPRHAEQPAPVRYQQVETDPSAV